MARGDACTDQYGRKRELILERVIGITVGRMFHPAIVQITETGHGSTSLARRNARSISRPGVFSVCFTNSPTRNEIRAAFRQRAFSCLPASMRGVAKR